MPSDDKTSKPLPSAEDIAAYLELSAARTKKRLTIAKLPVEKDEAAPPVRRALPVDRKLPVSTARAAQPGAAPPLPGGAPEADSQWKPPTESEPE